MTTTRVFVSIPFVLLLAAMLFLTSGCSRPKVQLAVASQPNINPDHSGRPSPVLVKMYELRSDLTFRQADFHTLFEQPMQTLGADLVAADELVFIPGEARKVAYEPMPETRFVGIVAGFRQMERAQWRVLVPINPEKANSICLELIDVTIIMIPPDKADDWEPVEAVQQFQQKMRQPAQPTFVKTEPSAGAPAAASPSIAPAPAPQDQQGYALPAAKRTTAQ